jgi:hypothetical protein
MFIYDKNIRTRSKLEFINLFTIKLFPNYIGQIDFNIRYFIYIIYKFFELKHH